MTKRVAASVLGCVYGLVAGAGSAEAADAPLVPVHLRQVRVGGFWKEQVKLLTEEWLPHCVRQMEKGGRGQELLNLVMAGQARRGEPHGKYAGAPWSDAYIYNAVEAACLALEVDPEGDAELAKAQAFLRAKIEEWTPIILGAQFPDGYIHSFHTVNGHPRYSNIGWHEFYVMGYFLEMGIAHTQATGGKDRRLYEAALRCADHLCETFGPAPKRTWKNGHPGLELALCRLGGLVNEVEGAGKGDKYVALARHFLDHQHQIAPNAYDQSDKPAVEMSEATGHAVRATYFYTAMADIALATGSDAYRGAVDRLWSSAIDRKHFITGGVGASHRGEAFAADFDLRQDAYLESCASCGLSFWSDRMFRLHQDATYRDVQERVLYNNLLGSIERSGENFYYQNPPASALGRYPWHGCPCCIGNIPRALIAIKDLMYATDRERKTLYLTHFVESDATLPAIAGAHLRIRQETRYPWQGDVAVTLEPAAPVEFALKIRIPNRTESPLYTAVPDLAGRFTVRLNGEAQKVAVEKGFVTLRRVWRKGDRVELSLPMDVQRIRCDERVAACRGRVALQRGPVVYSAEEADNGRFVRTAVLKPDVPLKATWKGDLLGGVMVVEGPGFTAVPNYARLNRGGWSQVWTVENREQAGLGSSLNYPAISVSFCRGGMSFEGIDSPTAARNFDFWPHKGGREWVQYDFPAPVTASQVTVRWFDDTGRGECRVPASWRLVYFTADGKWQPVEGVKEYPVARNTPVSVSFTPVKTSALRLEVQLPEGFSAGVWEWAVR